MRLTQDFDNKQVSWASLLLDRSNLSSITTALHEIGTAYHEDHEQMHVEIVISIETLSGFERKVRVEGSWCINDHEFYNLHKTKIS